MQPEPDQPSTWKQPPSSKACQLCKTRHQKCSRARPACQYCQARRVDCIYSDTISTIRPARVFADVEASVTPPNECRGGPSTQSDVEIANQNGIPSNDLAVAKSVPSTNQAMISGAAETSSNSSPPSWPVEIGSCKENSTDFLLDSLASLCADKSKKGKDQILEENEFTESDSTTLACLASSVRRGFITLDEQLPDKAIARGWLNTILRGPNLLFRICDEAESWRLLDAIYAQEHISHASRCSIWLQLAAGCRFTTGTAKETYVTLYDSGCQFLEWCIEQTDDVAPLWVVPPMLLRCLYSMSVKPKACWLTLGAAIRLAQVHNLDRGSESCPQLSAEEYEWWRGVWRAMIFLDMWLSTTLGKRPQISPTTTQDSFVKMTLEDFALPDPSSEVNVSKLSMLASRFLVCQCQNECNVSTQVAFLHALEKWASNLPQNLRDFPDTDDPHSSEANSVGSLYLEIFYFASVMTLTKPGFFASLSTGRQQNSPHSRLFSQACTDASIQIGHVASRILDRGILCKRSWLIMTLVYHAGLVLALSLNAQTSPQRYNLKPVESYRPEHKGLEANMDVLSSCAPHNSMAGHCYKVLHYFKGMIDGREETKSGSASLLDGREFFGTPSLPSMPLYGGNLTTATTSPISSFWHTSSDAQPWIFPCPTPTPYGMPRGIDLTVPTNNNFSQSPVANYLRPSLSDPTSLEWTTNLSNHGSNRSLVSSSSSQQSSMNSELDYYEPYMQDFWPTDPLGFAQPSHTQGNTQGQYG